MPVMAHHGCRKKLKKNYRFYIRVCVMLCDVLCRMMMYMMSRCCRRRQ